MTKFDKVKKIGSSDFLFRTIWFRQFSEQEQDINLLEDLKIQEVLRHEKRLKSTKKSRWKKSKLDAEVIKIGLFSFGYRSIQFF
jgi:hypothetical protein